MSLLVFLSAAWLLSACNHVKRGFNSPRIIDAPEIISENRVVPPVEGPSLKFLVFGDQGTGRKLQTQVAHGMAEILGELGAQLVIGVGDNFYEDGVDSADDSQFVDKFEAVYDVGVFGMIPFYMSLGNHDYLGNVQAQIQYDLENRGSGRWNMPDRYYTFEKKIDDNSTAAFYATDTQILNRAVLGDEGKEQLDSLDVWLGRSRARWKIVFGHHPPYSNGARHGNQENMQRHLSRLLEKHDVDAGFFGHDHDVQALEPVNGVHYFVSGNGARSRDVFWKENTRFALTGGGFIWARITHDEFLVAIVDKDGMIRWNGPVEK